MLLEWLHVKLAGERGTSWYLPSHCISFLTANSDPMQMKPFFQVVLQHLLRGKKMFLLLLFAISMVAISSSG